MNAPKFKNSTEYYFLKAAHLHRQVENLSNELEWRTQALNHANNKPVKAVSPFYVVFDKDVGGNYVNPKIVRADSPEEALCPEGCEEPTGQFCQRLMHESEYMDI